MDEKDLKRLIESRYDSVRAFALENDIPYTTMRSILERGVMNARAETIFKICDILGINSESFADKKPDWQPSIDLSNLREKVVMFDGKPLSDDDVKKIEQIIRLSIEVTEMKIDELLKEYKISLFIFPAELWERSGFYFPDLRRIYVNESLSKQEREKVILHEIGHVNHDPKHYKRLLLQYENQADRFMIRELLIDYLKSTDIYDFNWVRFAAQYDISTTWGEAMIQDEFRKIQQNVI